MNGNEGAEEQDSTCVHSWIDYVTLPWLALRKCKNCPAFMLNDLVLVPAEVRERAKVQPR